ncbi:unnamed protein product [Caenorhabditis angaria]|uniref:Glycosyltransferase family 92 protein n=1 Tax=Caenorhabditis angaria TaxID=860376 RepID=A0A9P1IPP6_9PELO|nr:unnamed protein product [Caenorhabditis angaria]
MIIFPFFFLVTQIFLAESKGASLESQIARKYLDVVKDSINNRKENAFLNGLAEDVNVHTCHENLVYKDFTKVRAQNTTSIIYDDKLTKANVENDNEIAANYLSVRIGSDGQVLVRKNLVKLRLDNYLPQFKAKLVRNDCALPAHEILAKIYRNEGKAELKTSVTSTIKTTPVSEYWNLGTASTTKSIPFEIEESEFKNLKSPKSKQ